MSRPFDIGGPATALRLYLILIIIWCAARGETVTYEELAQRAHQANKGLLTSPLDLVAAWCQANGLPALTLAGKPAPSVDATYNGNVAPEQDKPSVAELTPAQCRTTIASASLWRGSLLSIFTFQLLTIPLAVGGRDRFIGVVDGMASVVPLASR
jgi:hypothetical protein